MSDKLSNKEDIFFDVSDYARPIALRITSLLLNTSVSSVQVTWLFLSAGLCSAVLYSQGTRPGEFIAGILLLLKNILDAVDGSLARARNRPSRVGRFLDAIFDYIVNLGLFLSIATGLNLGWLGIAYCLLAHQAATLQCSWYNYVSVQYRHQKHGDISSQVDESSLNPFPWDDLRTLKILHRIYWVMYAWQDQIMRQIDHLTISDSLQRLKAYEDKSLLTLSSFMGLGSQLLVFVVLGWLGTLTWIPFIFIIPGNLFWLLILVIRWKNYRIGSPPEK
jgi:phosphatidylglycerophosphate synthase